MNPAIVSCAIIGCTHTPSISPYLLVMTNQSIEDNSPLDVSKLATSNTQQIGLIKTILTELGLCIATPEQTSNRLALKGRSQVVHGG